METDQTIVEQTKAWITKVVAGCNFCPFAAREVKREGIRYKVVRNANMETGLQTLALELIQLDDDKTIETTLLIFPDTFGDFKKYLDLVEVSEELVGDMGKEGIYQVASFHPEYVFAGSKKNDPANYTNRSIYPMIHILRESSVTAALANFDHPEMIPERNIAFANKMGLARMQALRDACMMPGDQP